MKHFICLMIITLSTLSASAMVVKLDQEMKRIFINPNTTILLSLQDLENDGGFLYVSSQFKSSDTDIEVQKLRKNFPDYDILTVPARATNDTATLRIRNIIQKEVSLLNDQMGPQVNDIIRLTKEQVHALKQLDLTKSSIINIQARANFITEVIDEKYSTNTNICNEFNVTSIQDLFIRFAVLSQPPEIKNKSTWDDYRKALLTKCFKTQPNTINSFTDILSLRVQSTQAEGDISGITIKKANVDVIFPAQPIINSEVL